MVRHLTLIDGVWHEAAVIINLSLDATNKGLDSGRGATQSMLVEPGQSACLNNILLSAV